MCSFQGDYLSGKPGNVQELAAVKETSRKDLVRENHLLLTSRLGLCQRLVDSGRPYVACFNDFCCAPCGSGAVS